jgi:dihydrofolate reductase
MRLTTTTFMTLDGVVQAPGAPDEDRTGGFARGGWLVPYADDGMGAFIAEVFERADAFLLGRRTFEIFAGHWPHVPDDNPVAAALNRLPKYVASRSELAVQWAGSSLIGSNLVDDVEALKARPGRELQVHGSGQLVQSLIEANLIDEDRVLVYPVFLGEGRRLFAQPGPAGALRLTGTQTTGSGIVILTYEPAGLPQQGSFALSPEPDQHRILR